IIVHLLKLKFRQRVESELPRGRKLGMFVPANEKQVAKRRARRGERNVDACALVKQIFGEVGHLLLLTANDTLSCRLTRGEPWTLLSGDRVAGLLQQIVRRCLQTASRSEAGRG